MEGAEKSEKESPPLQIDPKCFQDALRAFFQPIKSDDPRLDFYKMYKREAVEYDTDYVKKFDEDLNTTLIFAGLFSAVSSAFVIDVHSKLQPDPNEQSAALLRAILLTLNQSAIPGETPAVPPVQDSPPSGIVTVTGLMYASLLISLLAAFIAMLGKQWLNRYLWNSGGSTIERCGDRQRKCDGLEKWPLRPFVESLPVMLQVALLLLACGLCRHMWSISTPVAYTLVTLTGLGVLFYLAIVIAGTSSYACPFQTPVSIALRSSWKKVRCGISSPTIHPKRALSRIRRMWNRGVQRLLRRRSLPVIPLENVRVQQSEPWLKLKDLVIIHKTNTSDARCVSWILINITDPEALDAAARLAGVIRWFVDGSNVKPSYDMIVSAFEACFDSTGNLYPQSRDKAYYSGRAMMWIHTLAMCKSEDFARTFPLPTTRYTTSALDPDLEHLLLVNEAQQPADRFLWLLRIHQGITPSHSQWISNILLHLSWANRNPLDFVFIQDYLPSTNETPIPLNVILNRLLAWCIFLGSPVEEEALKVQDKSDRLEHILHQLSDAIVSTINTAHSQRELIPYVLRDLANLENRPGYLTEMAHEWCSVICNNRQGFEDWENLLFDFLEIGFRHLDPQHHRIQAELTYTEHYQILVDTAFKSKKSEVIADLLYAWTTIAGGRSTGRGFFNICARHLVDLHDLVPFSPRLRRLVIRSVGIIGFKVFEGVGVERFVDLLNDLHVAVEDMDGESRWTGILLDTLRSSEGAQHLSHYYWKLLVELAISASAWMRGFLTYSPQITTSLTEAQEWDKLECWMGTVWVAWPPEADGIKEEDLSRTMLLLFRQRPGAAQKLEQWMERWSQQHGEDIPESFQQICKQAYEAAQRDAPSISSTDNGAEGSICSSPPAPSPPPRGNEFWESLPY